MSIVINGEEHLQLEEVAKRWNLGVSCIYLRSRRGEFSGAFKLGNAWFYPMSCVVKHETHEPRMTRGEVAERWGVHRATVYNWIRIGKLPGAFKVGREWFLPTSYVLEYEKAHTAADGRPLAPAAEA